MRYMRTEYKRQILFVFYIYLATLIGFLFWCVFASLAHAGVEMSTSGKLKIVDLRKTEFADFDLRPIMDKVKRGESIKEDVRNIDRARKLYAAMDSILDKAFIVDGDDKLKRAVDAGELSETGGGFAFGEIEMQKIADRIYKQIVSSSTVADIDAINNVIYQIIDKARMKQSFRAEAKELERIRKVIHDAKERAENVLTAAEIQKLLEQAEMVLSKAKKETEEILEAAITRQNFGAMVFCGSEVIK